MAVCYPDSDADAEVPPGDYTNAALLGCYAMNGDIFFQLMFDGESRFVDVHWSATSGEVRYGGTYTVSGDQLICNYFDGKVETYTLVIYADGITLDGTFYQYTGSECQ